MGKNKGKQIKAISKTIGTKPNKVKTKAKPVKSQLKRINNLKTKAKVVQIDKQLIELQDKVRQSVVKKVPNVEAKTLDRSGDADIKSKEFQKLQEKSEAALDELHQMQL